MNEPVENLVFDFLEEGFNAAPDGSDLHGIELHDTLFKKIETSAGVRIGDAESDFAPEAGGTDLKEYDAFLTLVAYAKIEGADKTERRAARTKAFRIALSVAALFVADQEMGGRVCNSRVLTGRRGFDSINSQPYAVVNLPIVFNESGAVNFERRNY